MIRENKKEPHRNKPVGYKGGTLYGRIYDDLYQGGKLYKNLLLEKKFSDIIENIKEKISSQIPTKEIIALDLSKRILENLPKKEKENFRRDIEYEDRLLRNDKIIFQKPEIKYRKKDLDLLSSSILNKDLELDEDQELDED
jgi:hypothetical protein